MKNIFLRIFVIFIASAVFVSCSKEKLTLSKSSETTSIAKMYPPVFTYGGISGALIPAPYYAAIKIYNDDMNTGTYCYADQAGYFKMGGLIPGNYHIMVVYILNYQATPPEPVEYRYYEIRGIVVKENLVTELGDIILTK